MTLDEVLGFLNRIHAVTGIEGESPSLSLEVDGSGHIRLTDDGPNVCTWDTLHVLELLVRYGDIQRMKADAEL